MTPYSPVMIRKIPSCSDYLREDRASQKEIIQPYRKPRKSAPIPPPDFPGKDLVSEVGKFMSIHVFAARPTLHPSPPKGNLGLSWPPPLNHQSSGALKLLGFMECCMTHREFLGFAFSSLEKFPSKNWRNPKHHQGTCYLSIFRAGLIFPCNKVLTVW